MTSAPIITGAGLSLRPHRIDDLDLLRAFHRSPRAHMMDVPEDRTAMWYSFAAEHGSWSLRGMGSWAIDEGGALARRLGATRDDTAPRHDATDLVHRHRIAA
jgi:hypothetical protein